MMGQTLRFATIPERIIESTHIVAWLAIGTAMGWLASLRAASPNRVMLIESLAVGVFGAFIGGEFLPALMSSTAGGATLSVGAVALSMGCAVAALLGLGLMRRAVGPLRAGKPRTRR